MAWSVKSDLPNRTKRWTDGPNYAATVAHLFGRDAESAKLKLHVVNPMLTNTKAGKNSFILFFLKEIGKRNANVRPPRNTRKWVTLLKYLKKPPLLNFDNDLHLVNYFKKYEIIVILISSFGKLYEDWRLFPSEESSSQMQLLAYRRAALWSGWMVYWSVVWMVGQWTFLMSMIGKKSDYVIRLLET